MKIFTITCLLVTCQLFSCHKTGLLTDKADAQISFYNASEYVQNQLKQSNGGAKIDILIDTPDTTTHADGSSLYLAAFRNNNSNLYQFPNLSSPWISYMRIPSGLHTVVLTDTSSNHRPLAYTRVSGIPGEPRTIYYADSLGQFRTWILTDTVNIPDKYIGIRVMDLSPDAGKVFFTINGLPAAGFPDSLQYGQVTPFVRLPNPVADTLQLRFYNVSDSADIVALVFLSASPGHAYNLILRGYQNGQSFADQGTGQSLSFLPDLNAVTTQCK